MLKIAEEVTQNPANTAIINTELLKTCKTENGLSNQNNVYRWSVDEIVALFELPFSDLMHRAQIVHRENFNPNAVQVSTLLSIKTG
ncbi:MAG: hypothetical protein H7Z20_06120, partial [Bdellovibrio sp.]|nr:hypothetical protein [Methylotenera sp.]